MAEIICVSPVDGTVVDRRPTASRAEIDQALARARAAQTEWGNVAIRDRGKIVLSAVAALGSVNTDVVQELAMQMGRPVRYGGEFGGVDERASYMVSIAEQALASIIPVEAERDCRYIRRCPVGTVLTIAPWNYPFLTAINSIVPALMAGNSVLFKAASQTVLTGDRFQQAFDAAGLPAGLFQNLVLSHDDTTRVISGGHVDHVCFTGSVEGGRVIEKAAAGTFTSLGLELGGKDPAYVRADVDLASAIENLVDGAFFNSGQSCCGIERIYVDDTIYDQFVEGFIEQAKRYVLGDPRDPEVTLGPMAATRFADHVRAQVGAAVASGATANIDPRQFACNAEGTPFLAPQVVTGVDHDMDLMLEESFGPVVGIMKVGSDQQAIDLMNDTRYGLTASIWTKDLEAALDVGNRVDTGTVFANRCDYLDPGLAWTGVKETGRGASLSKVGYEMLTRPKSFHLREG